LEAEVLDLSGLLNNPQFAGDRAGCDAWIPSLHTPSESCETNEQRVANNIKKFNGSVELIVEKGFVNFIAAFYTA
jgi:hypothetical protein